jgi:hypothetical protein
VVESVVVLDLADWAGSHCLAVLLSESSQSLTITMPAKARQPNK